MLEASMLDRLVTQALNHQLDEVHTLANDQSKPAPITPYGKSNLLDNPPRRRFAFLRLRRGEYARAVLSACRAM